ncbi:MAG TPA: N(4)-(beta-N-acetylglucosaminyl)-L-asparaginase [Bacteroidia bacterium]|nr:N(4)-(beta-N-acetylglucosaminyl)-L-asparaginase [Bacteroidia bacterium]HNP97625.1 N(4)-(beta-N-acetylglucosaminyl)-L-asparaginase [Bacteroidia bacterium]
MSTKSRRDFLKISGIGSLLFINLPKSFAFRRPNVDPGAIVLSTWSHGVPANIAAWEILSKGGRALDAVEAGVKIPEADPAVSSVGYGGLPDRDGRVTLDACIMDEKAGCGSVAFLEHIVHPISVARLVMEKTPHVMLVGEGALKFALDQGFKKENLLTPESEAAWKEWLKKSEYKPVVNWENHDTIGMIALDQQGNLSGACTTSGMAYKLHGRVGDSPIIGAGLYVDNEVGAATSTGVGEEVIRICGSHLVVELMRQGKSPEDACRIAVERIVKKQPQKSKEIQVGFLALNKHGEYGSYCLQKGFNYAVRSQSVNNELIDAKSHY